MLREQRKALTVVELLVVISLVALLTALLLPAVMQSRERARVTQCSNNLRNLGIAVLGEASSRCRFPGSGYFGAGGQYHNWVVAVLPRLERSDIHSQWDFDKPYDDPSNKALSRSQLNILICPDDSSTVPGQGNLSYVVNGGVGWTVPDDCPVTFRSALSRTPGVQPFDLGGDGFASANAPTTSASVRDRAIFFRLGLFFIENWPMAEGNHRHHSLDSVFDGLSQTIMLTENVRVGYDSAHDTTWAAPGPLWNSFILSGYICDNASCASGHVDYTKSNNRAGGPWEYEAINSGLRFPEGEAPWPSSFHPSAVNVVFADGHVRLVSDSIDGVVYAGLVSPQGAGMHGPLVQRLVEDASF